MIKTLRESKAKLSELVELVGKGEDVLITVRGKVRARLTKALPNTSAMDMQTWARELENLQTRYSTAQVKLKSEHILSSDREERF
jgi:prevent-host-death family protein